MQELIRTGGNAQVGTHQNRGGDAQVGTHQNGGGDAQVGTHQNRGGGGGFNLEMPWTLAI